MVTVAQPSAVPTNKVTTFAVVLITAKVVIVLAASQWEVFNDPIWPQFAEVLVAYSASYFVKDKPNVVKKNA